MNETEENLTPNQKAKVLNILARQKEPNLNELSDNERGYVRGIRWTLLRYWRREISADQARAEQRLWQIRWLQGSSSLKLT